MAKARRPRLALGMITRADGVRVEVKNPTIWKLLNEQQATLQSQQQLLEGLKGAIAKIKAQRDHDRGWVNALDRHWWVRLGVRLRIVRLHVLTAIPDSRDPAGPELARAAIDTGTGRGTSAAAPAATVAT